jgi:hypothetical protein
MRQSYLALQSTVAQPVVGSVPRIEDEPDVTYVGVELADRQSSLLTPLSSRYTF